MPYKLGTLLKKHNIVTDKEIQKAIEFQKKTGFLLGESLLHLNLSKEEEVNYGILKQIEINSEIKKKGFNFKELKPLFKRLLAYKFYLSMSIFLSFLTALFSGEIIGPLTIGFIIDHIIPSADIPLLGLVVVSAISAVVLSHILSTFTNYCNFVLVSKFSNDLVNDIFYHINSLSYPFFSKFKKGDLLTRISENVEQIIQIMQLLISSIFLNFFLLVYVVFILFMFDVKLTLITMVFMFGCLFIPSIVLSKANKYINNAPVIIGQISVYLKELFANYKYIVSNNKRNVYLNLFKEKMKEHFKNDFFKWINWNLAFDIKVAFNTFIPAIILFYGGHLVMNGILTVGNLISFYLLWVAQFTPIMDYIYFAYSHLQYVKPTWRRVKEILDYPVDNIDIQNTRIDYLKIKKDIKIVNMSFKYILKDEHIFKNINAEFEKGNIYSIIGKSGTGKSSFLKVLLCLYKATEGNIYFDNYAIDQIAHYDLWANIGYMSQDSFIYENKSILDNIKLGASGINNNISYDDIVKAAKKAQIYKRIMSYPKQFDTIIGQDDVVFSGGEKQRIALARIFLKNPFVIILDEPTAALDQKNTEIIINTIIKESKDKIVLISSHKLDFLAKIPNLLHFKNDSVEFVKNNLRLVKKHLTEFKKEMEK